MHARSHTRAHTHARMRTYIYLGCVGATVRSPESRPNGLAALLQESGYGARATVGKVSSTSMTFNVIHWSSGREGHNYRRDLVI